MTKPIKIIIAVSLALLAGAAVFFVGFSDQTNNDLGTSSTSHQASEDNGTPERAQDKIGVIEKGNSVQEPPSSSPNGSTDTAKQDVIPIIVSVLNTGSSLNIRAYAPVVEINSTCVAKVSNKATQAIFESQPVKTLPDASTTVCELISIPLSSLDSGANDITVEYDSAVFSGVSSIWKEML